MPFAPYGRAMLDALSLSFWFCFAVPVCFKMSGHLTVLCILLGIDVIALTVINYEGRYINKLQNDIIVFSFKILKIRPLYF